jgi:hypothetical protein
LKAAEAQFRSGRGAPQYFSAVNFARVSDFRVREPETNRSAKE